MRYPGGQISLDLGGMSRKELQAICELQALPSSGNVRELQRVITSAIKPGKKLGVCGSRDGKFHDATVTRLLSDNHFEVCFSKTGKLGVYDLCTTAIFHPSEESEVYTTDDDDSEEEESEEDDPHTAVADMLAYLAPKDSVLRGMSRLDLEDFLRDRGMPVADSLRELKADARYYLQHARVRMADLLEDVNSWTVKELKAYCLVHDLRSQGTKDLLRSIVLKDQLTSIIAEQVKEAHGGEYTEEDTDTEEDDDHGLRDMSKRDLQAELRERGLSTRGTREELEERLREALEEEEESEEHTPRQSEYDSDGRIGGLTAGFAGLSTRDSPDSVLFGGMGPRKRALIVGASCKGSSGFLPGTLNDVYAIRDLLVESFGFPDTQDSLMLLTDDHKERFLLPTRRNILRGFEWLMRDLQSGDSLFFYFSGHGGCDPDPTGEEPSGYNQVICPVDHTSDGIITDTEIHKMLVKDLPMGVTLHALIDSCHSGTVMNLPWNAVLQRGKFTGWEEEYKGQSWKKTSAGGLVVQFSASKHDQMAVERRVRSSRSRSENQGAATYAFINAIESHKDIWGFNIVYGDLLQAMHDELRKERRFNEQEPTLSASTAFDLLSHRTKLKL